MSVTVPEGTARASMRRTSGSMWRLGEELVEAGERIQVTGWRGIAASSVGSGTD